MAQIVRTSFFDGIRPTVDPLVIPEHSMWKANNLRSDVSGILRLREGSINIFPSLGNSPVQGFIYAFEQLLFVWNKKLYRYDRETDVLAVVSNTDLTDTEFSTVNMIKWTTSGAEIVYIFGGIDIFETDGITVTPITPYVPGVGEDANMLANPTGPQNATLAVLKASLSQRVAVSGVASSPNTVYFSAPLDITYFPLTQVLQLPDDGGYITGLANYQNALVIFRNKDIWAFFGTDLTDGSASLVLLDGSVGCQAPKSIVQVPELGVVFLGHDNIYSLQTLTGVENQSKANAISDVVSNYVREAVSFGGLKDVTAVYFNREYRICFPNATIDERILRLSLLNQPAWYTDSGPLTNHYIAIGNELFGSYHNQGSLHQITKETIFDEAVYKTLSSNNGMYNDFVYNQESESTVFRDLTGIPFSVTFRREDLQPGPSRIKRIFLYVMNLGTRREKYITHFGNVFNENPYNVPKSVLVIVDTSSDQDFDLTLIVDGNEVQVDYVEVHSKRINETFIARSEPVRIYEAIIRPSLKGHFAQVKIDSKETGQLIGILGYGIDYQPKGRIRGIRDGVKNNKA